jgi:hypothetical protein
MCSARAFTSCTMMQESVCARKLTIGSMQRKSDLTGCLKISVVVENSKCIVLTSPFAQ